MGNQFILDQTLKVLRMIDLAPTIL